MEVRMLRGNDVLPVKDLDEISGNNVFQYIEGVGPLNSTEDAWGIFDKGYLLGYCSTGTANGVISVPGMNYDAILLSDLYIREECRGIGVATCLIREALLHFTDKDFYLCYLDEKLLRFYEPLGFRHIPGTNIMERKACDMIYFEVKLISGYTSELVGGFYPALCREDAVVTAFRSHGRSFEHTLVSVTLVRERVRNDEKKFSKDLVPEDTAKIFETSKTIADIKERWGLLPDSPHVADPDTIIAELVNKSEPFGFPGVAEDIFNVWKRSADKAAVEQMFYEFTGCGFKKYLGACLHEMREIDFITTSAVDSKDEIVSGIKAVDIEWKVSETYDLESLPKEVEIPRYVAEQQEDNPDAISEYLTEVTGFSSKGFRIVGYADKSF